MYKSEAKQILERLLSVNILIGNETTAVSMAIDALEKQMPKKIVSACKIGNEIGGYCPNCHGTVRIEKTWLVKAKGQHCSWCGQKLDCDEV